MGDEKKLAVIEPEAGEQVGECCEPECGPTTCPPGAEAPETPVAEARVVEDPKETSCGCGPSTYS